MQGTGGAKGLWRSEPWCPALGSIIITASNEKWWPQHPETLLGTHICFGLWEQRDEMRRERFKFFIQLLRRTPSLSSLFISRDTEIRGHSDTIEPPHFRLISRFRPKTHLHSLRAVTQTDSLQKTHFFNEFLNPHSNPAKTMRPGPNSPGHGISSLNYFNKYEMPSY